MSKINISKKDLRSSYFREPGLLFRVPIVHSPVLWVSVGVGVGAVLISLAIELLHPQLLHKLFV